jgi:rSAM/selenodomain-associated transferase 2
MKLSIIVPVLNEASALPPLLEALCALAEQGCEVIIADGGSTDGTLDVVRRHVRDAGASARASLVLLHAARGRATQMNAGAAHASGDVLLFLHADTALPDGALPAIEQALDGADGKGGKLATHWGRFDVRISGRAPMLVVIGHMMNWRSRWSGIATGDQAMFVRRTSFVAVGGFPEQPLMEDIALSNKLRAVSRPACIAQCVLTSGRRWEARGLWRTIWLMWRLRFAYWRGVPASKLADAYR